jgi:alpha-galactosidase
LQVGNGVVDLNLSKSQAHFSLWAILKAPLLIGTDLRAIDSDRLAILLNKEVIAINQDSLGVAGDLIYQHGPGQVRL